MSGKLMVFVTCGNAREARNIARALVKERLAACVNLHTPAVRSVYRWQGKVEQANEVLLTIKTSSRLFPRVERRVKQLHSYDTPEILGVTVAAGSRDYLKWLEESLVPNRSKRRAR